MYSVQHFWHRLEAMTGGGRLGWCLVIALATTCLGALWLLLAVLGAGRHAKPMATTLTAALLALVLGWVTVEQSRREFVALLRGAYSTGDPSQNARLIALAIGRVLDTLNLGARVLAPAALPIVFALVRKRQLTLGRGLAVSAATLGAASAVAVGAAIDALMVGFHCYRDCQYAALSDSIARLHHGKLAMAAVAGLAWVLLLLRARQQAARGVEESRAALGTSSAVLVLGLGAFLATRGMAWDARHPIQLDNDHVTECGGPRRLRDSLPSAPANLDCAALAAPAIELRPEGTFFDGAETKRPEDLEAGLTGKRELWLLLNPDRAFPGAILLLAPRQTPTRDLLPWLSAAQRAGFSKVDAYLRAPTLDLPTGTLGVLHRERCCAKAFVLDETSGTPLTRFETWGDLTNAQRSSELTVALR